MKAGQILSNRYQIKKEIPSGPNNYLYVAFDKVSLRSVIVKTFAQAMVWDSVLPNKQNLLSLNSPYIPKIIAVDVMDGENCLIEEYIEGISLKGFLSEHAITYQNFFDIFSNLLDALDAMHRCQLVHGDVKPQNIFVKQENGKTAGVLIDIDSAFMHDRRRTFYGTLSYAAPEQLLENRYIAKTDIYSLGLVACYMIEGRLPFDGSREGLHRRMAGADAITLSSIQNDLVKMDLEILLNEMIDLEPSNRPSIANIQKRLQVIRNKVELLHQMDQAIRTAGNMSNEDKLIDQTQCVTVTLGGFQPVRDENPTSDLCLQGTYRSKLMEEYDNLSRQATITFKLWVATFVLGIGIITVTVVMICMGKYVEALMSAVLESLVFFAQKLFAIREDYYRKQNDSKLKHLETGDSYEYLMSTLKNMDSEYIKKKIDLIWKATISSNKTNSGSSNT